MDMVHSFNGRNLILAEKVPSKIIACAFHISADSYLWIVREQTK